MEAFRTLKRYFVFETSRTGQGAPLTRIVSPNTPLYTVLVALARTPGSSEREGSIEG